MATSATEPRNRRLAVTTTAAAAVAFSLRWLHGEFHRRPGDWLPSFLTPRLALTGSGRGPHGLQLYAAVPKLHIGPLSVPFGFLAGPGQGTFWPTAVSLLMFLPVVAAIVLAQPTGERRVTVSGVVMALALVPPWLDAGAIWLHFDNLMACVFALAAAAAIGRGRPMLAGLFLGIGLGASLNELFFLPLLFAVTGNRVRLRAAGIAAGIAAGSWLPFLAAAPAATWDAIRSNDLTWQDSVWDPLWRYAWNPGHAHIASLPRDVQTAACLLAVVVVMRYRGVGPALVAGCAVRVALDSMPTGYQILGLVTAGVIADLLARSTNARWTIATLLCALAPVSTDVDQARAALRVVCTLGLLIWIGTDQADPTPAQSRAARARRASR
jgi:hypothetical protein